MIPGPRAVLPLRHLAALGAAVALAACSRAEHVVVVYSPLEPDLLAWAEAAYGKARSDVDLRLAPMSSDAVLARLTGERGAPQADVVWGAPSWIFAAAAGRGLLAEGVPSWAPAVPAEWRDPRGRWVASLVDPIVLAFDLDGLSRSAAPRDWVDLLHPRFAGDLLIPEPGVSDAGTLLLGARAAASLRSYGDALDAIGWFLRLDVQARAYGPDESELLRRMSRGEGLVAPVRLSVAERVRASEPAIDFRFPESATPLLVQGVAVVAGAPDRDAALDFVEWLGSDDAVRELAERFRSIPARALAADEAPPWLSEAMRSLRADIVPADTLAEHLTEWLALWRAEARGRGTRLLIP